MQIWEFISSKLSTGNKLVIIIVVESLGSSPGKRGFKMAVSSDGEMIGSVGGGIMEFNMVEKARKMMETGTGDPLTLRQVHDPSAAENRSGLICAGEQTHLFMLLDKAHTDIVTRIVNDLSENIPGEVIFTKEGITYNPFKEGKGAHSSTSTENILWREETGYPETLIIFGGGHVSIPLSQVGKMLGFRVELFDNRNDLSTMATNNYPDIKRVIDYENADQVVSIPSRSFAVIMTFTHKTDEIVLSKLLPLDLRYLGMIGSRNKVKTIFNNLKEQGFSESLLQRVKSPVGLPIGSNTPEEIAISIAAEIIQIRNGG